MLRRSLFLGAVLALLPALGRAAEWQLRQQDDATGTRVYLRDRGGGEAPEFRAETRVKARLTALVALLLDTERMPAWVFRARRAAVLVGNEPTSGLSQVIFGMPWPLRDREAIVAWRVEQDPASGAVTIRGTSASERWPVDAAWVRMPNFESHWRFAPRGNGEVDVEFAGYGEPGGSLALPVLRSFAYAAVWEAPLATVIALRGQVQLPAYRDAVLPFVREPAP